MEKDVRTARIADEAKTFFLINLTERSLKHSRLPCVPDESNLLNLPLIVIHGKGWTTSMLNVYGQPAISERLTYSRKQNANKKGRSKTCPDESNCEK